MRKLPSALAITAAGVLTFTGTASAQILGGNLQGSVGAQVQTPPLGHAVRDVARETGRTAADVRATVRETAPRPIVNAGVRAGASTGVDADLGLRTGMTVRDSRGARVGVVERVVVSADGTVRRVLVRSGRAIRSLPLDALSVNGDVAVTTMTAAELSRR